MSVTQVKPTAEQMQIIKASGSKNLNESLKGVAQIAKALESPLRKAVLSGNILDGIFEPINIDETNSSAEFPLDFLAPGQEKHHVAYTIPNHGRIPERHVEGDYVIVPTYDVGNSIDWLLKYARDARWDIIRRALEVYQSGFTKKLNDDGWHTLIAAGVDRNIVVSDSDAGAGQFTKRLVSLMKTVMTRNGGGNSASNNRGVLTDLYLSPEAIEDIRNWNVDQIDEITRREIFVADDGSLNRIFGVNLHDVAELGEGQEYQLYITSELSVTLPGSDVEAVIGLDLRNNDSFVMPVKENVEVFEDPWLHRQKRAGVYGWWQGGFASLDGRRVLVGSL